MRRSPFSHRIDARLSEGGMGLTALSLNHRGQTYAVAPDGQFLLNDTLDEHPPPITIVLDWPALLPH